MSQRNQDINDIVIAAVEVGVNYWANIRRYRWHDPATGEDLDEATVEVQDFEGDGAWHLVGRAVVVRGLRKLAGYHKDGAPHPARQAHFRAIYHSLGTDNFDVDAEDADCIVQASLFGEVVYG
jgi:hypothetical protein